MTPAALLDDKKFRGKEDDEVEVVLEDCRNVAIIGFL